MIAKLKSAIDNNRNVIINQESTIANQGKTIANQRRIIANHEKTRPLAIKTQSSAIEKLQPTTKAQSQDMKTTKNAENVALGKLEQANQSPHYISRLWSAL